MLPGADGLLAESYTLGHPFSRWRATDGPGEAPYVNAARGSLAPQAVNLAVSIYAKRLTPETSSFWSETFSPGMLLVPKSIDFECDPNA